MTFAYRLNTPERAITLAISMTQELQSELLAAGIPL
jgi:hypothetical protein